MQGGVVVHEEGLGDLLTGLGDGHLRVGVGHLADGQVDRVPLVGLLINRICKGGKRRQGHQRHKY